MHTIDNRKNLVADLIWLGNHVRILGTPDTPLFVAKDICDVLGTDTRNISKILDPDEYLTCTIYTSGQAREVMVLSEGGLYHMIMISRKPEAKLFRRWITGEIMPTIRKQGYYQAAGIDPTIARIHQGHQLAAQARQLQLRADELQAQAEALLDFPDSATVQETLISLGLPHTGQHLLKAANRMLHASRRLGIPQSSRRSGARTYPRPAIISTLGLDQLTLTLDEA